ncbi:MAG: hypothetical protein AAF992_18525, partial [Bacteroidota bacterium]
WRRTFKFLPNTYKVKLTFEKMNHRISVNELKSYLIERISDLSEDDFRAKWIGDLKRARSYEELINGKIE